MMNKKIILFSLMIFLLAGVFAVGESSYCCEKTKDGAWCINVEDQAMCDTSFDSSVGRNLLAERGNCGTRGYCSLGTCIDLDEGRCIDNTERRTCENLGGYWNDSNVEDLTQCNLGCCFIGEGTAFVTQARCKALATIYSIHTQFRTDITDELECIASANLDEKGACVFSTDMEKTCLISTREECQEMEQSIPLKVMDKFNFELEEDKGIEVSFYAGKLCTAEELGTNCARSKETTCVEGKDEVYFLDTCGNIANIYDYSKIDNINYWTDIKEKGDEDICSLGTDLQNANTCGNCEYLEGSICREYESGVTDKPKEGDYVCGDLSCEYDTNLNGEIDDDEYYKHGERWCVEAPGISKIFAGDNETIPNPEKENLPGSRYYRAACYNGEVTIEECADYRQEICVETEVASGVTNAACQKNTWEDCFFKTTEEECTDIQSGDCQWINTGEFKEDLSQEQYENLRDNWLKERRISLKIEEDGTAEIYSAQPGGLEGGTKLTNDPIYLSPGILNPDAKWSEQYKAIEDYFQYACIPKYAPGYKFWEPESKNEETGKNITDVCAMASGTHIIKYSDGSGHTADKTLDDCADNCHCLPIDGPWLAYKQDYCLALGDCGYSVNYYQIESGRDWTDLFTRSEDV